MKIANKISLSFFITGVTLTCVTAVVLYRITSSILLRSISAQLIIAAQSRARHIETFLRTSEEMIAQASASVVIKQFLSANKKDEDYKQKFNNVTQRLKDTNKATEYIYEVFILNEHGIIVASSEESDIGKDKNNDSYFIGGKTGTFIKDAWISEEKKTNSIAFSAPIFDKENVNFLGVVVGRVSMEGINNIVEDRTGLGKTGEIYLVNRNGYMITPSRFFKDTFLKLKVDTENTRRAFEDIKKYGDKPHPHEPVLYTDYRGAKVFGVLDHISPMQWILLAEIDKKEVFAPLFQIRLIFIALMLIVPVLAWLIGRFVSKLITRPIHALHKGAEIIGQGNLGYKIPIETEDEIGLLAGSFNKMTEDLRNSTMSIGSLNKEVTERKKIEEALRDSKTFFRTAIIGLPLSIFVLNCQGEFTLSERQDLEVLDIFPQNVLGKSFRAVFAGKPKILECIQGAVDGQRAQLTIDIGKSTLEIRCSPILNERGALEGIIGVSIDITERRKMEDQLRQVNENLLKNERALKNMLYDLKEAHDELKDTQEQLLQSEKIAAIGQLSVGVAHEVKNPLAIILLSIESLESRLDHLGEKDKKYIQMIKDASDRANKVIAELLSFSRQSEMQWNPLNIHEIIDSTVNLIDNSAKINNIAVKKEYAPLDPLIINGNSSLLGQVFLNLFNNAIDAIGSDGTTTIKTYIPEDTNIDDNHVVVEVSDTGKGMPGETISKVFEPFFTTKEQGKGTGLGLSTAHTIIERHRGSVTVESQEGVGTKFIIKFPMDKV